MTVDNDQQWRTLRFAFIAGHVVGAGGNPTPADVTTAQQEADRWIDSLHPDFAHFSEIVSATT